VFEDWGDVKLPTLKALYERGIVPETLFQFFEGIGLKRTDITISWENIYALNRKSVDKIAKRYYFVPDPVKLVVKNAPEIETIVPYHPDFPERGGRRYKFKKGVHEFFVPRKEI
jgi:glutamyl-tRNA synthetase